MWHDDTLYQRNKRAKRAGVEEDIGQNLKKKGGKQYRGFHKYFSVNIKCKY